MTEQELQNEETWDFDRAEKHEGGRSRRSVVSVAFAREDFQAVAKAARRAGMSVSEFIRRATMEKVSPTPAYSGSLLISCGGSGRTSFYGTAPTSFTLPAFALKEAVQWSGHPGTLVESR